MKGRTDSNCNMGEDHLTPVSIEIERECFVASYGGFLICHGV